MGCFLVSKSNGASTCRREAAVQLYVKLIQDSSLKVKGRAPPDPYQLFYFISMVWWNDFELFEFTSANFSLPFYNNKKGAMRRGELSVRAFFFFVGSGGSIVWSRLH